MIEKMRDVLLAHRGKDNAIAAIEISSMLGLPLEATQSTCRKLIHKTANFYHLPLFSSKKGFYIAQTKEELREYNENIQQRINGMIHNRDVVNANFKKWNPHLFEGEL